MTRPKANRRKSTQVINDQLQSKSMQDLRDGVFNGRLLRAMAYEALLKGCNRRQRREALERDK